MITIISQPEGLTINGNFYPKNKIVAQYTQNKVRFLYEHKIITDFNDIADVTIDGNLHTNLEDLQHTLHLVI